MSFVMLGQAWPESPVEQQQEFFKDVRKAGWTGERAVETLRENVVEDREGRKFIDMQAMPKEA